MCVKPGGDARSIPRLFIRVAPSVAPSPTRCGGTANGFQEHLWFATCRCCYLRRWHSEMARQARSSRVYPVPGLVTAPVRLDGATGNGTKAGASGCAGRPFPLNGAGPREHPRSLADGRLARLAPMTPQSPVFLKLGPAVTYSAYAGDWGRRPVQVTLPATHPRPAHRSMTVMVRGIYFIDPSGAADFRSYLLTRRYPRGRPDPFRSVQDLGLSLPVVHAGPRHPKVVHPYGSQRGSQEPARDRPHRAGDGPRPVRAGSRLALGL
jgi:hypothetical protein